MKNGHTQKLLNEVKVVLTENDVEVCIRYVKDQTEADQLLESWKDGTLQFLRD